MESLLFFPCANEEQALRSRGHSLANVFVDTYYQGCGR